MGRASVALLELRDVAAGYGSIQILHRVSLHVNAGEVVSVIGPNGAGKSTTFKIIMGFIEHLGGQIVFDGHDLVGQRPDRILGLGLGYVPQGRVVFGPMTVRENLEMGAYRERRRQLAGSMSGGEQQMLAMGRALMMRPKMMMLDEPSLGLSPRFVDEVFDRIVDRALEISDRGYVLELGRNRFEGAGQVLLQTPEVKRLYLGGEARPLSG